MLLGCSSEGDTGIIQGNTIRTVTIYDIEDSIPELPLTSTGPAFLLNTEQREVSKIRDYGTS